MSKPRDVRIIIRHVDTDRRTDGRTHATSIDYIKVGGSLTFAPNYCSILNDVLFLYFFHPYIPIILWKKILVSCVLENPSYTYMYMYMYMYIHMLCIY